MSYTDLRDFEPEYSITFDDGTTVQIEKMGGGTLGKKYEGIWRYIVTDRNGVELGRGQDFTVGIPKSHSEVAEQVWECFQEEQ